MKETRRGEMKKYITRRILRRDHTEGSKLPRFYLPVWRSYDADTLELWVFPLAPFVWSWRVFSSISMILWRDFLDWQIQIQKYRKLKD
jgi:hypothetical protein